ncbi:DnaC-like helicase loader [Polaribacter phage Freya_1]|uniref:DNA replication protein n=1 Tax=Polaribacter phage Freya_1 TaxID=2745662 RepID=A0A8E5EBU5_9CAUD|nr:DnaC-like helicase loader [Polaribacter phage Freya_1]QQV90993.1 DNA replication protein [Polaribacter phage Freya_2]QQV91061.1 DNA replication protein [Polaribacter phage Freya_3]QQV91129.1 DNA replication protein [Polaribacter phage Freya_4]QQV91204.1 DNA replication protein [Polaribacter phage Freya_8]QQV91281.1 DNA replication protein [Polaribacter phage Freya_9]QQV91359.1 DNA replication protein [Polaribacter phage Freya_10]QYV99938.1 DNA replication protein [Polaribacter phage Freya
MIDVKNLIGRRKYEALKKFDFENMSAEDMVYFKNTFKISVAKAEKMVLDYEIHNKKPSPEVTEYSKEYNRKLLLTPEKKYKSLTKEELWSRFVSNFQKLTRKKLIKDADFIKNMEPIFYYFIRNFEEFKKCERLSDVSVPSFKKGLLIIGDFGNGKSTIMNVLEMSLRKTSMYFKGYSANEVVLAFDACKTPTEKTTFIKRYSKGVLYFDDIKSERRTENYGNKELFREILENRYNNNAITFITCNYKKGFEGDLKTALAEFGEKYGDRVNDRIYEMFNVIEFKGKSLRV